MTVIARPTFAARTALVDEWQECDPRTDDEIATFYRDNVTLAADLNEWHQGVGRRERTEYLVRFALDKGVASILDVGCGMGHDLAALKAAGVPHLLGVEPNSQMRATVHRRGIDCVSDLTMARGRYDLVLCCDVLEHLPDPDAFLDQLMAQVGPGGYLVEVTATHDVNDPLHLKRNWGWLPDSRLRKHGFVCIERNGFAGYWQKQADKAATEQSLLFMVYRNVAIQTFESLLPLVSNGKWWVYTLGGDGLISRVRSRAVSQWWRLSPDDVFMILDDDVTFSVADAERVCQRARETRGIACGAYIKGDASGPALRFLPGTEVVMGRDGDPPVEVLWAATGFMAVHRDVIAKMIPTMPLCQPHDRNEAFWPFFQPYVHNHEYLSEDYAFCARARELGFIVELLPDIRLGHIKPQEIGLRSVAEKAKLDQIDGLDRAAIAFRAYDIPAVLQDGPRDPGRAD